LSYTSASLSPCVSIMNDLVQIYSSSNDQHCLDPNGTCSMIDKGIRFTDSLEYSDEFTNQTEVFILDMIMQTNFLLIYFHFIRIILFNSPQIQIWPLYNKSIVPIISHWSSYLYNLLHSKILHVILLITIVLNTIIIFFRILYFIFSVGCLTWYGTFVTFIFLIIHIIFPLLSLNVASLIIDKKEVRELYKDETVKLLLRKYYSMSDVKLEDMNNDNNGSDANNNFELKIFADCVFETILDIAARIHFFDGPPEKGYYEENLNDIEEKQEKNMQYTFLCILHDEISSYNM
jgi:hypothetical protein